MLGSTKSPFKAGEGVKVLPFKARLARRVLASAAMSTLSKRLY
jgi:hypothetical protein